MKKPSWNWDGSFLPAGELAQDQKVPCKLLGEKRQQWLNPTVNPVNCSANLKSRYDKCHNCYGSKATSLRLELRLPSEEKIYAWAYKTQTPKII